MYILYLFYVKKYVQYMYLMNQNPFEKDKDFIIIECMIYPAVRVVKVIYQIELPH